MTSAYVLRVMELYEMWIVLGSQIPHTKKEGET